MQPFDYRTPGTTAQALSAAAQEDARYIAGGQTLLQSMKLGLIAPATVVDVTGIAELKGVRAAIPALAALAGQIGDRQVRHRGTLGGSLANNDPAACYPAAVLGLGATVHTNQRRIAADDFFLGVYTTALAEGELITAVSFPIPAKAGWQKFRQPASRFALVGVFVAQGPAGVRVAVTGAGSGGVFRATGLEQKLAANWSAAALAGASVPAEGLNSDLHGSAAYRAALIPELAARALG